MTWKPEMPTGPVDGKNTRRSERVLLTVAVVVSVALDDRKVVSEPTFPQIFNAHGGLLTLRMKLVTGQRFLLENLKTGKVRQCSVVRTEESANNELLVAFQFATPAPDFWPIVFPPKDWRVPES
jgi:hypothetical protein